MKQKYPKGRKLLGEDPWRLLLACLAALFVESLLEWEQVKKPKVSYVVYFNCHHLWVFMLGSHSLSLS